jgi:hypothetical protein
VDLTGHPTAFWRQMPNSGAEARKTLINPVTLTSKDAETLECEMRYTHDRARSNLQDFNRTWQGVNTGTDSEDD